MLVYMFKHICLRCKPVKWPKRYASMETVQHDHQVLETAKVNSDRSRVSFRVD